MCYAHFAFKDKIPTLTLILFGLTLMLPSIAGAVEAGGTPVPPESTPSLIWVFPFVMVLLAIALLPQVPRAADWWDPHHHKLMVTGAFAGVTCLYYGLRGYGFAGSESGFGAVTEVLRHSIVGDYIPFVVLLFSLFSISGGIRITGNFPAHPAVNCTFMLAGALLASFIGTTGASMLLIRPLLQVNRERKHVKHTVVFFIFLAGNIGGLLLPVGDPPLFLGYLRGVPFLWTLTLWFPWLFMTVVLLAVYFVLDTWMYRHEEKKDLALDESKHIPLRLHGKRNFVLLGGVLLAVAFLVPGQPIPFTGIIVPPYFVREIAMLILAALSLQTTPRHIHAENHFNFSAITEVACLFIGIFICMQAPIEILKARGADLGIDSPLAFFWASGILSSVLDNAPTYVVFFELAGAQAHGTFETLSHVATGTGYIPVPELAAISCGSVFMGANTYIGNGPNFLIKSIAEHHGIKMPSFIGYMGYSFVFLIPLFAVLSVLLFM